MRARTVVLAELILLGVFSAHGRAEEQARKANPDENSIRKAAAQYRDALERGDMAAVAAAWVPDGVYEDANGATFKASDLIKKQFAGGPPKRASETRAAALPASTIRFVTSDVAIEDGISEARSPDADEAVRGRFTVVWKKAGGRWLIDSLREASLPPVSSGPQAAADARLAELAWLVGDWTGSSGKLTFDISAKFLDDERVLERRFAIRQEDRTILVGTEYISRDNELGEITSQSISSRGGHEDGVWRLDDHVWTVEAVGVTADGDTLESTCSFTPHEDGSITWSVLDASIDGDALPETYVRLVRKPSK